MQAPRVSTSCNWLSETPRPTSVNKRRRLRNTRCSGASDGSARLLCLPIRTPGLGPPLARQRHSSGRSSGLHSQWSPVRKTTLIYKHLGWRITDEPIWCEQPGGRVKLEDDAARFMSCQGDADWPRGAIALG